MSDFDENFWKLDYYVFIYYSTWSNLQTFCLFVPNLIFIDIVLERSLEENSYPESFYKTGEVINEGFTS